MRNKAKCKNCKTVVESKHRHDFTVCKCYTSTGKDVAKIGAGAIKNIEKYVKGLNKEQLDHIEHQIRCAAHVVIGRGFFLDGGGEYNRFGGKLSDLEWITVE